MPLPPPPPSGLVNLSANYRGVPYSATSYGGGGGGGGGVRVRILGRAHKSGSPPWGRGELRDAAGGRRVGFKGFATGSPSSLPVLSPGLFLSRCLSQSHPLGPPPSIHPLCAAPLYFSGEEEGERERDTAEVGKTASPGERSRNRGEIKRAVGTREKIASLVNFDDRLSPSLSLPRALSPLAAPSLGLSFFLPLSSSLSFLFYIVSCCPLFLALSFSPSRPRYLSLLLCSPLSSAVALHVVTVADRKLGHEASLGTRGQEGDKETDEPRPGKFSARKNPAPSRGYYGTGILCAEESRYRRACTSVAIQRHVARMIVRESRKRFGREIQL